MLKKSDSFSSIRILPMNKKDEFSNKTIKDVQEKFFLKDLSLKNNCEYFYIGKKLDVENNALILFQYNNAIIAFAILEKIEKFNQLKEGKYKGKYYFKYDSIAIVQPITLEEISTIWEKVKRFGNALYDLDKKKYPMFWKFLNKKEVVYAKEYLKEFDTKNNQLVKLNLPKLKPSNRDREFNSYSQSKKDKVTYKYLFDGKSHRWLDSNVLNLNVERSKGYQSMSILHYLGIKNEYKGLFKEFEIKDIIEKLICEDKNEYEEIILSLKRYSKNDNTNDKELIDEAEYIKNLEIEIKVSRDDNDKNRKKRLKLSKKKPQKIKVLTNAYKRNTDVIVEVLNRAKGICEYCKNKAPFNRKSDGTPYLEVHHIIPLFEGGEDTVENTVALCPNCHKKVHFGE